MVKALTKVGITFGQKTYSHSTKFCFCPAGKVVFSASRKSIPRYPGARSIIVQLVYHLIDRPVSDQTGIRKSPDSKRCLTHISATKDQHI